MSLKKSLTIFVIILAVFSGVSGFWYYQKNIYSKEILKLEILGPETAELAQEIEYLVKYKNNGNIRLEEAKLIFEAPEYSLREGKPLREEIKLDDIYPGQENTIPFKVRLFGKENETKIAKAWLTFKPKGLEASYETNTTFTTIIRKVPLTFEFDLPSKIGAGKELTFNLNFFSNTDYPLSDLRIQIEYPSDFEFISSKPQALEKTEWEIGLLNKAEGGRIEILGRLSGGVGEEKIFKAKLGIWQEGEFILLKEVFKGVEIIKPSLFISQQINGNPQYIASPGDLLHYEIFFKNIGQENLTNLFLVTKLEGQAFDLETIKSDRGEHKSGDNSIIWDWRKVSKLQFLASQEEGKVEFWVKLKKEWPFEGPGDKNPILRNHIYLSQAQEEFETKVNSKLEISQKGYFQDEVFGNSGPIPPKVAETTTYTIIWQAKNFYNDLKNVKVKASLPPEVKLTGKIFPESEISKFAFDSVSREIVWDIGEMEAGQGVLNEGRNLAFQIALTPENSQRGQTALLISQTKIIGEDTFTQTILEEVASSTDTTLPDDPTINESQGVIQ